MPDPVKIVAGLLCLGSAMMLRAMDLQACVEVQAVEFGSIGTAGGTSAGSSLRRPADEPLMNG